MCKRVLKSSLRKKIISTPHLMFGHMVNFSELGWRANFSAPYVHVCIKATDFKKENAGNHFLQWSIWMVNCLHIVTCQLFSVNEQSGSSCLKSM